jgi:hypothetical protein
MTPWSHSRPDDATGVIATDLFRRTRVWLVDATILWTHYVRWTPVR